MKKWMRSLLVLACALAFVASCGDSEADEGIRLHIINGDNLSLIFVTVSVGDATYDVGELETADVCCTGPNFVVEGEVGTLITIEARSAGAASASQTCQVTPEAATGMGARLQAFVNIFFEGQELVVVCDLGLTDA